jgi:N-acetylneuraminic acid mutarotase
MLTNRSDHTATLLLDGKVLIAGGMNQHSLASAELYDPNTGTWTETGSMMVARAYHTATLLPSGKVLVAGGATCDSALHCTYLASAELYDPQTGTWASAGRMHDARITHTATLLSSGKVLVVGGYGADNTSLGGELYDPRTDAWVATSAMIANRSFHTATLLPNRQVLVAGGCLDADCGTVFSSAELYDPATNMWTATSSMTMARAYHTATLLTDGRVLVTGGEDRSSAELYSPDIRRWTATSSMASDRHSQTATLLSDGQVLVVGGLDDDNTALSSAELYVPRSPLLPLTIRIPAYAVLSDGPLPLSLTTTPGALVIITLRIRSGNGAILYRTGFQGIADVQGHFTHALGCAYLPTKPVPAILTVTVRTGRGAATKTVTVTLAH